MAGGFRGYLVISRGAGGAAGVARGRCQHALDTLEDRLRSPKASTRENRHLLSRLMGKRVVAGSCRDGGSSRSAASSANNCSHRQAKKRATQRDGSKHGVLHGGRCIQPGDTEMLTGLKSYARSKFRSGEAPNSKCEG